MGTTAEKLTYLNTTKQKIKDAINNIGGNITSETTFRQYVAALESIYQSMPKVSGSGTSLSLSPTLKGLMQSTLKGNTSQVQLSGKNIIASFRESTANRINYNLDTNGLTTTMVLSLISNTSVSDVAVNLRTITDAGVYTMGNISLVANTRVSFSFTLTTTQINTLKSTDSVLQLYKGSSGLSGVSLSEVQIENGTATTYEQYCGGTPSPNPSYPQDIHNVSGNNNIVVCGKNLFDKDNPNVLNVYINTSGVIKANSQNNAIYILCKPNTTYTISRIKPSSGNSKFAIGTTSETPVAEAQCIDFIRNDTADDITITTSSNAKYLIVWLWVTDYTMSWQDTIDSLQVEINETPTAYEAYNCTTYPINLPSGMELCKIGTYHDYFYKDSGKWYLHKKIAKKVASDFTSSSITTTSQGFYFNPNSTNVMANRTLKIFSKTQTWKNIIDANWNTLDGGYIGVLYNVQQIYINKYDTVANIISWLNTINFEMYYVLETPTYTEITDTTLISQLEAIYNAKSKNGTTNINQENNDLGFILDVSCLKGA